MLLKSIKTFIFSLIIISHNMTLNSLFKQSKEQDFHEAFAYTKQHNPQKTDQQIKDYILAMSTAASKKDKIMPLQNLKQNVLSSGNNAIAEQVQDILDAFDALKKRMRIPAEVEMFFLSDDAEDALYNVFDRKIYISPRFFGDTPTKRLFKLIHEGTHSQQHIQEGIIPMIDGTKSVEREREADTQAAQAISCPTCMQIIEDDFNQNSNRADLGYLTKNDIAAYKKAKQVQNICNAHKANTPANQELQTLLAADPNSLNMFQRAWAWIQKEKKSQQRAELDFKIESLLDRLSTVKFTKPF